MYKTCLKRCCLDGVCSGRYLLLFELKHNPVFHLSTNHIIMTAEEVHMKTSLHLLDTFLLRVQGKCHR